MYEKWKFVQSKTVKRKICLNLEYNRNFYHPAWVHSLFLNLDKIKFQVFDCEGDRQKYVSFLNSSNVLPRIECELSPYEIFSLEKSLLTFSSTVSAITIQH